MAVAPLNYAFQSDESIRDGFVRILHELATRAASLSQSKGNSVEDLVHDGRVLAKRLRALIWFARPALAETIYEQAKAQLRKASGLLSGQRDLAVTRATLKKLANAHSTPQDKSAVTQVARKMVESSGVKAAADEQHQALRGAMNVLCECIGDVEQSAKSAEDWPSAKKRSKKALDVMRVTAKKAQRTKADTDFHEWRKKAKRLFYQLELAAPTAGGHQAYRLKLANKLQDKLGKYHDAVVVVGQLKKVKTERSTEKRALSLLKKRKARLRRKAKKIEDRL